MQNSSHTFSIKRFGVWTTRPDFVVCFSKGIVLDSGEFGTTLEGETEGTGTGTDTGFFTCTALCNTFGKACGVTDGSP